MRFLLAYRRRRHVAVLFMFSLLTVVLTFPLITRVTTHVPGSATWAFDEYTFLWSQWWFKHALLDLHSSPLHTNLLFYPLGLDLVLYTYNFFHAVLGLPLQLAANVPVASNLMLWFATVSSGYGAFLLARWLLRGRAAAGPHRASGPGQAGDAPTPALTPTFLPALLAGLLYAFASNRAVYQALGHYNIAGVQWLPFALLYALKTMDARGTQAWRSAALAGLFGGFLLLTDMTFGVFLALALAILIPFHLSRVTPSPAQPATAHAPSPPTPPTRLHVSRFTSSRFTPFVLFILIAALTSSYLLVPTVREMVSGHYGLEGWGDALKLSNDLAGLVTPVALHPLWGQNWTQALRAAETGDARFADVNTVFLGYLTLVMAGLGALVARRRVRGWVWLAVVSALLSLGPLLQINGRYRFDLDGLLPGGVPIPLPFALLHFIPFVNANRTPNRFGIPLMLALAVLVAFAAHWLMTRRSMSPRLNLGLALILGLFLLFEHLAWPMPLTDARTPSVYAQLAAEPGQFALMQLPLGWRNGFHVFGSEDTRVQWYQHVHGRPILSGNAVRNPPFKFTYFERLPLFQALTGLEMYQEPAPALDAAARAQAAALMTLFDVRFLVVNPPVAGRFPYSDTWQATRDYALQVLPVDAQPLATGDGVEVYRVDAPAPNMPWQLDFGSQDTFPYRGDFWDIDEADLAGASAVWITGRQTEIFFPARPATQDAFRLQLRITPYSYPGAPRQAVQVRLNGRLLGEADLAPGWQEIAFSAAPGQVIEGPNTVELSFTWNRSPRDAQPETAVIGRTGVRAPRLIDVHAFGEAFITLTAAGGEAVDASTGRRGMNVAVIDAASGALLDRRGFDTAANAYEAQALADYLATIPAGRIIVLATKGDAGAYLTAAARDALARAGIDAALEPGDSLAAAGVQGAPAGSAAQARGAGDAYLHVGGDTRPLAAAIDWFRVEAVAP